MNKATEQVLTRPITPDDVTFIRTIKSTRTPVWKVEGTSTIILIICVLSGFLFGWEIIPTVIGSLVGGTLWLLFGALGYKINNSFIDRDLKEGKVHIITGPLKVEGLAGGRGSTTYINYLIGEFRLDVVAKSKGKSQFEKYPEGTVLRVEYLPHSEHVIKVSR